MMPISNGGLDNPTLPHTGVVAGVYILNAGRPAFFFNGMIPRANVLCPPHPVATHGGETTIKCQADNGFEMSKDSIVNIIDNVSI